MHVMAVSYHQGVTTTTVFQDSWKEDGQRQKHLDTFSGTAWIVRKIHSQALQQFGKSTRSEDWYCRSNRLRCTMVNPSQRKFRCSSAGIFASVSESTTEFELNSQTTSVHDTSITYSFLVATDLSIYPSSTISLRRHCIGTAKPPLFTKMTPWFPTVKVRDKLCHITNIQRKPTYLKGESFAETGRRKHHRNWKAKTALKLIGRQKHHRNWGILKRQNSCYNHSGIANFFKF